MVKRVIFGAVLITNILFMPGCQSVQNETGIMGTKNLELMPIEYEVIGDTSAEETRISIIGIDFEHLFQDKIATITSSEKKGFFNIIEYLCDKTKKGALYKALQKIPQADKLIEPKYEIDSFNLYLFKKCTVKVMAKAIKFTKAGQYAKR